MSVIDGQWHCKMDTPMGEQSVSLTLATDGSVLSGGADTPFGRYELRDGTVDGSDLTWRMTVTQPMPMELDFKATVEGDALSGVVAAGPFGEQRFTGTRVAS